ncbi:MAG: TerB family tellurite resistance protein [Candidatus Krumholzibacteria bacterium]|jgi:uncharacterized tellurite resistance protein B-like protein|nr:TerB family tellurite resistance protein [Candidatus Krumholzibacteria bacterium]
MLERLRGWFEMQPGDGSFDPACIQRAVCLLLVAAARADGHFAVDEAREIARLVGRRFALPAAETAELVAAAAAAETKDLYPATRVLTERLDRAQRREVLALMWQVVYSDGKLEAHEEALMRRAARLLDVPARDLVALKLTVRQDLGRD